MQIPFINIILQDFLMIYLSRIQSQTSWQKAFKLIFFSDKDFSVIENAEPQRKRQLPRLRDSKVALYDKGHFHLCSEEH